MAQCECLDDCPFFEEKVGSRRNITRIYQTRYCLGKHTDCARYLVYNGLGKSEVPADLYPNQDVRAREILEAGASAPA